MEPGYIDQVYYFVDKSASCFCKHIALDEWDNGNKIMEKFIQYKVIQVPNTGKDLGLVVDLS